MSRRNVDLTKAKLDHQLDHQNDADSEKSKAGLKEQRARSLAAMGLVAREKDRFFVKTAATRDRQQSFQVWRDGSGRVCCSCPEFEELLSADPVFRCEHILAVKFFLKTETSNNEEEPMKTEESKNAQLPEDRKIETEESGQENQNEITESPNQTETTQTEKEPQTLETAPVVPTVFANLLRSLRQPVDSRLIKTREGWTDRHGNIHMVEYVEWHTVADMLDRIAPNWSHSVRNITQIGDLVAVIAAITIDNVTREGIGTGSAESEMGIKKAEHDALKRAAVKFGIARDLYQRESDVMEGGEGVMHSSTVTQDPLAKTLADLVTPKQLGMIRALGREIGCDIEEECQSILHCGTEGLSKRAASNLIDHLKRKQQEVEKERENNGLRQAS
jgi:hypothetical protein